MAKKKKVQVRLLVPLAGEFAGKDSPVAGDVLEVDADLAKEMVGEDDPIVELVEDRDSDAPEAAMRPKGEAREKR